MIYLIDEKKERQKNMGWGNDLLELYKDILVPIYDNESLQNIKGDMFGVNNVILFHESFFDNSESADAGGSIDVRKEISFFIKKSNQFLVSFGGSRGCRMIEGNTAAMPVEILYQNLGYFLEYIRNAEIIDLKHLVFGTSNSKEELLQSKLKIWHLLYDRADNDLFIINPALRKAIFKWETASGRNLQVENITNKYLKYQLREA